MATFAERFKILREETGLNKSQIASKFNCNKSSITRYENGKQTPEIYTCAEYAKFFSCSVDYILCRTEDENGLVYGCYDYNEEPHEMKRPKMDRLIELREEKNLTLDDLSKELCIPIEHLEKIEDGYMDIPTSLFSKFCKFYNVTVDYILGFTNVRDLNLNYPNTATFSSSPEELEKAKKVIEFFKSLDSGGK